MKVCTNPWSMKDREYWSKKAKNILAKLLLRDEISSMEYGAIKDIGFFGSAYRRVIYCKREVVDSIERGESIEKDNKI